MDPVAGAVKAADVLRPGGLLAPFNHVFQAPPEVIDALDQACRRAGAPVNLQPLKQALDTFQALFGKIADGIRAAGAFSEPEQWRFDWERTYTRNEWLGQLPTHGHLNLLPQGKRAAVLQEVGAAIDAIGGSFTMSYTTVAITPPGPRTGEHKHIPVSPPARTRRRAGRSQLIPFGIIGFDARPGATGSHHLVGEREQDGLQLGVGLDRGAAALAAHARLPEAAERRVRLELVAVDPDRAGPEALVTRIARRTSEVHTVAASP